MHSNVSSCPQNLLFTFAPSVKKSLSPLLKITAGYMSVLNIMILLCKASAVVNVLNTFNSNSIVVTRKLSYRKDDRAMRPIYGCLENFPQSLSTPTATFAEIFNGFCFDRSYCVYKF